MKLPRGVGGWGTQTKQKPSSCWLTTAHGGRKTSWWNQTVNVMSKREGDAGMMARQNAEPIIDDGVFSGHFAEKKKGEKKVLVLLVLSKRLKFFGGGREERSRRIRHPFRLDYTGGSHNRALKVLSKFLVWNLGCGCVLVSSLLKKSLWEKKKARIRTNLICFFLFLVFGTVSKIRYWFEFSGTQSSRVTAATKPKNPIKLAQDHNLSVIESHKQTNIKNL